MKRGITLAILFVLLVAPFVLADNETDNSLSEASKVEDAYKCLEARLGDDCSSSLEDNIFSLLAIEKCKAEILAEAWDENECWPKSDCKIKTTAQAVLALDSAGSSTLNAEEWLFEHNTTPENIVINVQRNIFDENKKFRESNFRSIKTRCYGIHTDH